MRKIRVNRLMKILQIILVLTLTFGVCVVVAACNKCQHEFNQEITREATCVTKGEMTYTCEKCKHSYTEEIPLSDTHKLSNEYVVDGEYHYQKCELCDYATDKTAHSYASIVSSEPSTCTKHGCEVKSCVCGKTRTEELPLAEHDFTAYKNNGDTHCLKCKNCDATTGAELPHEYAIQGESTTSTCTTHGSETKACVCGATHTVELPLAAHKYDKILHDDDGHWTVCSVCDGLDPNHGKTAHEFEIEITAADCENDGSTVTTCKHCSYSNTVTTPKLGHNFDESTVVKTDNDNHYFECDRCRKAIGVVHAFENCDCPEEGVGNKPASCYGDGHQAQRCTVCEKIVCHRVPQTDDHKWSDDWENNGTHHWHACLNGDGKCVAKGSEEQHAWIEKSEPATCTENGRKWRECSVCGRVQDGSYGVIEAAGHDNEFVRVITAATCTENGEEELRCKTCGAVSTAVIKALGHDMTVYNMKKTDVNGHYAMCSVCGFTRERPSGHTWVEEIISDPTCTSDGLTKRTCSYCGFVDELTTHRDHHYIADDPTYTDPTKFADPTCTEYGWYMATCEYCHDHKKIVQENLGYAEHDVKEYPAKEMTETEPGNIRYWQCQVCGKYFTSHGCVDELTEEEVFIYPPRLLQPENIAELIEIALKLSNEVESRDYYQITATVGDVDSDAHSLLIDDGTLLYVTLTEKINTTTIKDGNEITLKGKLFRSGNDVTLVNCDVISVDSGESGVYSLSISMTSGYDDKAYMYASVDERGETFVANTINYNCLRKNDALTFSVYLYGTDVVLQKVVINGKPYTMTGNILQITVTEDVEAEFVFAKTNKCSVRIDVIDTSVFNGNVVDVDEYVSYEYNGGTNPDGRLYKDSHLTFYADNANITGINITYDAEWLAAHPEILDNAVYAIKSNGNKVGVQQGSANKNSQIVITLQGNDAFAALEYFVNVYQARVTEIVVLYETNNLI